MLEVHSSFRASASPQLQNKVSAQIPLVHLLCFFQKFFLCSQRKALMCHMTQGHTYPDRADQEKLEIFCPELRAAVTREESGPSTLSELSYIHFWVFQCWWELSEGNTRFAPLPWYKNCQFATLMCWCYSHRTCTSYTYNSSNGSQGPSEWPHNHLLFHHSQILFHLKTAEDWLSLWASIRHLRILKVKLFHSHQDNWAILSQPFPSFGSPARTLLSYIHNSQRCH